MMTRSGMSDDTQQGYQVRLSGYWERHNYSAPSLFIQKCDSSESASLLANKLNTRIQEVISDLWMTYQSLYRDDSNKLGNSVMIVRITEDGRIGWSFEKKRKGGGEYLTRGDIVTLADGRTKATILYILTEYHLEKGYVRDLWDTI